MTDALKTAFTNTAVSFLGDFASTRIGGVHGAAIRQLTKLNNTVMAATGGQHNLVSAAKELGFVTKAKEYLTNENGKFTDITSKLGQHYENAMAALAERSPAVHGHVNAALDKAKELGTAILGKVSEGKTTGEVVAQSTGIDPNKTSTRRV